MFAYTKIMQGIQAVSAAVTDAYFNLVTLLLPGNGTNGAQNNTFLDSSSNNFTITRNGNTTQGTFSPFSQTGWSNYFVTSGNYLSVADNTALQFGTGDFIVSAWIYLNSTSAENGIVCKGTSTTGWSFNVNSSGKLMWLSTTTAYTAATTLSANTWHYVVVSRVSGTIKIFLNGTEDYSVSLSTDYNQTSLVNIGRSRDGSHPFNGYISNVSLIKGSGVTTVTVPTSPTTNVAGTSLLTCQSNRFIDNSSNAFAITVNGTPSVQAFSPFAPTAAYSAATNGGSMYQDASGDYLSFATNTSAFQLGAGDWCCEGWVYRIVDSSTASYLMSGQTDQTTIAGSSFYMGMNGDTCSAFSGGSRVDLSVGTVNRYEWTHIAFCRTGSTVSVFKNGTRVATGTLSGTINNGNTTYPPKIGATGSSTGQEQYLSGVRIVKGSSPYDAASSTITFPTAPPTAITNTALLCNFTNAGITDATAKNDLETVGNAQISTTQSKFGGSSMYFDGTGDRLVVNTTTTNLFSFGTGDFTIEFWAWKSANGTSNFDGVIGTTNNTASTPSWFVELSSSRGFLMNVGGNLCQNNTTTGINDSTWHHWAVCRSGSTWYLFKDGTALTKTTDAIGTASITSGSIINIGREIDTNTSFDFNGYIDDFRITKGYARYTSSFTPPTAAFQLS